MAQQNQCIFEYSNFGNGYLRIYSLKDGKPTGAEIYIDLAEFHIKNGVVVKLDEFVERIKQELDKSQIGVIQSPLLLLRCSESYKSSLFLPVKNSFQAQYLYKKEIKAKHDKERFIAISNSYRSGVGYIYNTYFIPTSVIESFNKVEKLLNVEFVGVQPLGMFMNEIIDIKGTFVYFYIRKKVCTMILVSDKDLITSYDFDFKNEKDIVSRFLLVASKHEFEAEHMQITSYAIDSDEPINIDIGINKIVK
jgi:hypothetical protein